MKLGLTPLRLSVTNGTHTVTSSQPVGVEVYGWGFVMPMATLAVLSNSNSCGKIEQGNFYEKNHWLVSWFRRQRCRPESHPSTRNHDFSIQPGSNLCRQYCSGSDSWLFEGFSTGNNPTGMCSTPFNWGWRTVRAIPATLQLWIYNNPPVAFFLEAVLDTLDGSLNPLADGIFTFTSVSNIYVIELQTVFYSAYGRNNGRQRCV